MMMMIGAAQSHHLNPANQTQNHPWDPFEEPTSPPVASSFSFSHLLDSLAALHRYHPSNNDSLEPDPDLDLPVDAFSCDHFRMYEFKVRRCVRGRSHDWTECPYAHLGEKARRRDPRKCHYSGTACPDYRKGGCTKGDACEYSHGVFECWLHPSRYRTQPCKDGPACRRRVCFFAHTPDQLRVLPQHSPKGNGSGLNQLESGSPVRHHLVSSPTSVLATPSDSPPMSPSSPRVMSELVDYMRALQLGKIKMGPNCPSWGVRGGSKFALPRAAPLLKPKLCTPYSTPSRMTRSIFGEMDFWYGCLEEPAMERVEFGRDLRTKIYAKLSKENSLDLSDSKISAPDVGWVSELVN